MLVAEQFGISFYVKPWGRVSDGSFLPAWLVQRTTKDSEATAVTECVDASFDFECQANCLARKINMKVEFKLYYLKVKDSKLGAKDLVLKRKYMGEAIEVKGAVDKDAKDVLAAVRFQKPLPLCLLVFKLKALKRP